MNLPIDHQTKLPDLEFQIQGGLDDECRPVVLVRLGAEMAMLPISEAMTFGLEMITAAQQAETDHAVFEWLGEDKPTDERLARLREITDIRLKHLIDRAGLRAELAELDQAAAQVAKAAREQAPGALWPRTHEDGE